MANYLVRKIIVHQIDVKPDWQSVGTRLSLALYGAANRMGRMHKPFLEPLNLTFPQYLVILELLNDAPLTVCAFGTRLAMDTGTITSLLKRLDAACLITRTRDPCDERRVIVDLAPRSRATEADSRGVTDKITSACRFTEQDIDDLRHQLGALAHSNPT